jgi:HAD superfamily hydrolase (TIGR01484 family)
MKPWKDVAQDPKRSQWKILAFDLDDTLTTHSQLDSETIRHLELAGQKGFRRVVVTGRPSGWADALIKLLPVDAVVAEQGGTLIHWPKGRGRGVEPERLYWSPTGYKTEFTALLNSNGPKDFWSALQKRFPGIRKAGDQPYRLFDLAVDFAEERSPPLTFAEADEIRQLFEQHGAVAKVSSIHVNGWWGSFDKCQGLQTLVENLWGQNLLSHVVFTGDSPNDASLFSQVACSVGVANIRDFDEQKFDRPHYITIGREGQGACEVIRALL